MSEQKNITRTIVNFGISVFALIVILIVLLLVTYYVTPNNYDLVKLETDNFILDSQKEYIIEPGLNQTIKSSYLDNKFIGFDKETNLLVQNFLKSQGIVYLPGELIRVKYSSSIVIINSTDKPIKLLIKFYNEKI